MTSNVMADQFLLTLLLKIMHYFGPHVSMEHLTSFKIGPDGTLVHLAFRQKCNLVLCVKTPHKVNVKQISKQTNSSSYET